MAGIEEVVFDTDSRAHVDDLASRYREQMGRGDFESVIAWNALLGRPVPGLFHIELTPSDPEVDLRKLRTAGEVGRARKAMRK
jgi:hypothetical protein